MSYDYVFQNYDEGCTRGRGGMHGHGHLFQWNISYFHNFFRFQKYLLLKFKILNKK